MRIKLTEEQGNELAEYGFYSTGGGDPVNIEGHVYTYLDLEYDVQDHRWNTTHLCAFTRDDGKIFGMYYDVGLTENQENGFVYNQPELFEVSRTEQVVTTVTYNEIKE